MVCFQSWGAKFSYAFLELRRCHSWLPESSGADRLGQGPVYVLENEGTAEVSFYCSQ